MAVNLSPVFGAGAQLFDNNGVPLAGGLIYTYAAGTTTMLAAYTTASGSVAHSNPIVLNSSGRVSTGEIWLLSGSSYKFVVNDANSVLIGTYDNINGTGSNGEGYVTATQSQTVVTVPFTYVVGTNNLKVYVNGCKQVISLNYTETNSTTITFVSGLNVGDIVEFTQ
jgi:hypothetical protein